MWNTFKPTYCGLFSPQIESHTVCEYRWQPHVLQLQTPTMSSVCFPLKSRTGIIHIHPSLYSRLVDLFVLSHFISPMLPTRMFTCGNTSGEKSNTTLMQGARIAGYYPVCWWLTDRSNKLSQDSTSTLSIHSGSTWSHCCRCLSTCPALSRHVV